MTDHEMRNLIELFETGPVAFLTGAGISTDSGIPDYRGAGTPPRTPMNIHEFLGDPQFRKRFWAGASVNARTHTKNEPNSGHHAIARLEELGLSTGVLTQNVDDLHNRAGSRVVVELHGNGNRVTCTNCGTKYNRAEVIASFNELNPGYVESQKNVNINPDQDAAVTQYERVGVPSCEVCGGVLRPDIVYFGETVPLPVFDAAKDLVEQSSALIVAGSSLAVNTGIRLVSRAENLGLPIAVINRGPTAIDARSGIRIEAGTSETLTALLNAVS